MEFGEGNSACCVITPLPGESKQNITSGYEQRENHSEPADGLQAVSMSFAKKAFIPPKKHTRPFQISDIVHWFRRSYYDKKKYPFLYAHLNEDKSVRRWMRDEFRQMISMGMTIICHYYDVLTSKLGFQGSNGKWVNVSLAQIAKWLDVPLIRVKRFFSFLHRRGFIELHRKKKKLANGKWINYVSEKRILPAFFRQTLGEKAWNKIKEFKDKKYREAEPKTEEEKENLKKLSFIMKGAVTSSVKRPDVPLTDLSVQKKVAPQGLIQKACAKIMRKPLPPSNPEKERRLVDQAMYLHKCNPSRSMLEYLKELKAAPA